MKKATQLLLTIVLAMLVTTSAFSQINTEKRVIEVTGSAEMLIAPNEFTFKVTIIERIENKVKLTIELQEAKLKDELANLGVDVQKDLTIFDLTSVYISRKKTKDTLGSKDYRLKLKDLAKIEKLQEIADKLNIATLDLIDSTHSDLTTFRRETKIESVKAAKMKASYMLGAIGETIGKAVFIQEIPNEDESRNYPSNSRLNSNSNVFVIDGQASTNTLTFSKIKIRYSVLARFEIQ